MKSLFRIKQAIIVKQLRQLSRDRTTFIIWLQYALPELQDAQLIITQSKPGGRLFALHGTR